MTEKIIHTTHEKPAQLEQETAHIYDTHETSLDHNKSQEKDPRKTQEALQNARELAIEADIKHAKEDEQRNATPAEKRRGAPSKKQRASAFKSLMTDLQDEMDPSSKVTSKFIHNPIVEKTSDFLGATIARPNALLSGSISAFICITLLYFIAKNYGYQLSGFETIAAFIGGWLLGIIYDYIQTLLRRNKNN